MYIRKMAQRIHEAMSDTPVIVLNGARQTGKRTLLQSLVSPATRYYTLDDPAALAAVTADPAGFIASQPGAVMIDEVQRAPQLFLPMKYAVDQQRTPGRFILSGSANVMLLPKLADSLAGRMEVLTLWPLAQSELVAGGNNLVDALFASNTAAPWLWLQALHGLKPDLEGLRHRLLVGGYPEVVDRSSEARRTAWFSAYVQTIVQRDIRDLAQIDGLTQLPPLLALLAHKATGMLNTADLSRTLGLAQTTLKRYLTLLNMVFMVSLVPAWAPRESHRAQKTPKLFFNDSGLLAHLLGINNASLTALPGLHGGLFETFVFAELQKLVGWTEVGGGTGVQLMHYRTSGGSEVDFILQDRQGRIVGIEVKASTHITGDAFKGLRHLRELVGPQFHRGIVLHPGTQTVAFDAQLAAVPVQALWL
jgi:predicted AAA+ superfamily ATPase